MQKRLTAKLFHAVVVLGVGMTSGCSDDSTPTPSPGTSSSTSGGKGTSGAVAANDGGAATSSSSSGDAIPGWVCCG